jgi:uncharacterized protein
MNDPALLAKPLSDDEREALVAGLGEHSELDLDALYGLMQAIHVAPGLVPPNAWVAAVLPGGPVRFGDMAAANAFVGLLLRLYNEVGERLRAGDAIVPEADDVSRCDSFALGFLTGAALDKTWVADQERWSVVAWAPWLADMRGFVPKGRLADFEQDPEATKTRIRNELRSLVRAAYDSFAEQRAESARSAQAAAKAAVPARSGPRVGRNDPCPCGSGKKYKRCCIDAPNAPK